MNRVIVHFDLDAFYVACERELNPTRLAPPNPVAVSQYNPYGDHSERSGMNDPDRRIVAAPGVSIGSHDAKNNGGLIAVSYEARAAGVKRGDRGIEAVKKCPDLHVVQVPVKRGKADLSIYRDASRRVMTALMEEVKKYAVDLGLDELRGNNDDDDGEVMGRAVVSIKVEKASIDEIYIDLTRPATLLAEKIMKNAENVSHDGDSSKEKKLTLNDIIYRTNTISTTIGGLEDSSSSTPNTLSTLTLSKKDLSRGSSLQTLPQNKIDEPSHSFWSRPPSHFTPIEATLTIGCAIASLARTALLHRFANSCYTLSAGISTNKTIAKLASGLNKPNKQTMIDPTNPSALKRLFHPLPVNRLRGLGGVFGAEVCETLSVATVGDLAGVTMERLTRCFPEQAAFLFGMARGRCEEEVVERTRSLSIASSKNFRGELKLAANGMELERWTRDLCEEVVERVEVEREAYDRLPRKMIVGVRFEGMKGSMSKTAKVPGSLERYGDTGMRLVREIVDGNSSREGRAIVLLAVSVGDFVTGVSSLKLAFERNATKSNDSKTVATTNVTNTVEVDRKTWGYDVNEIDDNILAELPDDIKNEILQQQQQQQRKKSPKKRSIEHFFASEKTTEKAGGNEWERQKDGSTHLSPRERVDLMANCSKLRKKKNTITSFFT